MSWLSKLFGDDDPPKFSGMKPPPGKHEKIATANPDGTYKNYARPKQERPENTYDKYGLTPPPPKKGPIV